MSTRRLVPHENGPLMSSARVCQDDLGIYEVFSGSYLIFGGVTDWYAIQDLMKDSGRLRYPATKLLL